MTTIRVDADQILDWLAFVVRGLHYFHWQASIPATESVNVSALTARGERMIEALLNGRVSDRAEGALGDGAFEYQGVRFAEYPQKAAWRIAIYGGAVFADPARPLSTSTVFGALTGPDSWPRIKGVARGASADGL